MTTPSKGFWRGVIYPLIYLALHAAILAFVSIIVHSIIASGILSVSGAALLTGLIGWIDHTVLPNVNM